MSFIDDGISQSAACHLGFRYHIPLILFHFILFHFTIKLKQIHKYSAKL